MAPSKHASATRKGRAVEHLVAAVCVLATAGELNALTALVDDEGVDLALKRRNGTRTLDLQIKARFSDEEGSKQLRSGRFSAIVSKETFRPRADLSVLYVAINGKCAEIEVAWLVPSRVLDRDGELVTPRGKPHLRLSASAKPGTNDKWRGFRLSPEELPEALLKAVKALENPPR